jgi:hypothetical protein
MYFCYADESGDTGQYDPSNPTKTGSPYYILTGIVLPAAKWNLLLNILKSFRKQIARDGFVKYDEEFHCSEMIDPHKIVAFKQISIKDRWQLIEDFAHIIGKNDFQIIAVVIDKYNSNLNSAEYHITSVTRLYQAFDELLKVQKENGIVLFDRTNEKTTTTHVRKLLGTGSSGLTIPNVRIAKIVEDPFFQESSESLFIQAADVVAYTLKEKEFPQAARRKFQAHRIFERKLQSICYVSMVSKEDGIIRL